MDFEFIWGKRLQSIEPMRCIGHMKPMRIDN